MAKKYNYKQIEKKWLEAWSKLDYERAIDFDKKPKHYNLIEFPYPSGAGLHVGHCMGFGASDAYCRMKRMQGYNVLFPIGWDAFGLPTENYAIKSGVHPSVATKKNIDNFRNQMKMLGYAFDYSREIDTTDPDYYRWTQWIFLQFYEHAIIDGKLVEVDDNDRTTPRLAYQAEMPINWCPACKIGLANEEVINGKCERCGAETVKKMQKQWMLRITAYADRLIDDLETVEYLPRIKTQQVNWIGRSKGTNIQFKVIGRSGTVHDEEIEVFTTRADTLYGCTYMVVSPEHPIINRLGHHIQNYDEVQNYIDKAKKKSDLERTELQKEKTGVKLYGVSAINPINGREIDIYAADYVLASYGTGAVMAVPAHDERDFEFAKKHKIPIIDVVMPSVTDPVDPPKPGVETIFRKAIQAIVINPKTGKVMVLRWKKLPWTTFITGGVENDEDIIKAAEREIIEETGYSDIKYLKTLGGPVDSNFYANHKKVNRKARFSAIVFELKSDVRAEISKEERDIHEIDWVTWKELDADKNLKCSEYSIWKKRLSLSDQAFTDYGVLYNSGEFDGLDSKTAIEKITKKLKEINAGGFAVNYKLRDWIFSRQHYWGEPIPIVYCANCAKTNGNNQETKNNNQTNSNHQIPNTQIEYDIVPVAEESLPVTLPDVENYQPTDNGESPLAVISDWVNTSCPVCGGPAKRETDTMPNWAGSSWYYLAYAMKAKSKNLKAKNIFNECKDELGYWIPVDLYNGGMEHTTLHLLYSRFWHKFLYDIGMVNTAEPYQKRIAHGIILGPDNQKMSKSRGNVINPDDIVQKYGADATRAYIMFIGPYDQESAWNTKGIAGVSRFLNRVWDNSDKIKKTSIGRELLVPLHNLIKNISEDIEHYSLNTYIAKLMEFNNILISIEEIPEDAWTSFLKLLSPACPFIAEELWQKLGNENTIFESSWPEYDNKYLTADTITIVVQINGKVRAQIEVPSISSDRELEEAALSNEKVRQYLGDQTPKKIIVIPGKLVSIVI